MLMPWWIGALWMMAGLWVLWVTLTLFVIAMNVRNIALMLIAMNVRKGF